MQAKKESLYLRVEPKLKSEIEKEAKANDESITESVTRILNLYFDSQKWNEVQPEIKTLVSKLIEAQNRNTDLLVELFRLTQLIEKEVEDLDGFSEEEI